MTKPADKGPVPPGPLPRSNDTDLSRPAPEPALPFERDESPNREGPAGASRQVIEQAARDVARGVRDTERRGIPSDVPGPTGKPGPYPNGVPANVIPTESPGQGHQSGKTDEKKD